MIEFIIQNMSDGKTFEVSELVSDVEWKTDIDFQPGTFTFKLLGHEDFRPGYGDIVRFKYEDKNVFFGKIFKKKLGSDNNWSITCYDQMRYLKNEDTIVFKAMTSSERFKQICDLQGLKYKIVDASKWKAPASVQDKKSYFAMIQDVLDRTLINEGMWYIIRDNFGVLEHVSLNSLVTKLVIGDESLATDFEFEGSIDDSFNQIKLTKDNKDTKKREVYIVKDSKNIASWGKLQYHDKVDEKMTEAQIKSQAEMLLKSKNKPKRTLKIPCIGDMRVSAGSGVVLMISDLKKEGFAEQQLAIVSQCTHKFDTVHTMDLELKVV